MLITLLLPSCPHRPRALQGLPRATVRQQATELLDSVKLAGAAAVRTGAYSGGMRRRLRCDLACVVLVWVSEWLPAWGEGGCGVPLVAASQCLGLMHGRELARTHCPAPLAPTVKAYAHLTDMPTLLLLVARPLCSVALALLGDPLVGGTHDWGGEGSAGPAEGQ